MLTNDEARRCYGDSAINSRKGEFVLVLLDGPDDDLIRARTEEFDPDEHCEADCPLCEMLRAGCVVIFDEDEVEEVLLE